MKSCYDRKYNIGDSTNKLRGYLMLPSCSQNNTEAETSRLNKEILNSTDVNRNSIILAGNCAQESTNVETSDKQGLFCSAHDSCVVTYSSNDLRIDKIQKKCNLNKRIDTFEDTIEECRTSNCETNANPLISLEQIKIIQSSNKSESAQIASNFLEDTYTTNVIVTSVLENVNSINPKTNNESNSNDQKITNSQDLPSFGISTNQIEHSCSSDSDTTSNYKEASYAANKFDNFLISLDNIFNPTEAKLAETAMYKRLSEKFTHSPKYFTEKLLTIIEESVINNSSNMNNTSFINFDKFTKDLEQLCTKIEDESVPDILLSTTMNVSLNVDDAKKIENINSVHEREMANDAASHAAINTSDNDVYLTPLNLSFQSDMGTADSSSSNECYNSTFECLEAQCERLFPREEKTSVCIPQNQSLMNMDEILQICEKQMALLNTTDTSLKATSITLSPNPVIENVYCSNETQKVSKNNNSPNTIEKTHLFSNNNTTENNDVKKQPEKISHNDQNTIYETIEMCKKSQSTLFSTDELEKTLLLEIAEKKRRCLDTAKIIMEINAETEPVKKGTSPLIRNEDNLQCDATLSQRDSAPFLKMLTSCRDYHLYLEKQISLFNTTYNQCLTSINNINQQTELNIDQINLNVNKKETVTSTTPNLRKMLTNKNVSKLDLCHTLHRNSTPKFINFEKGDNRFPVLQRNFLRTPSKTPVNTQKPECSSSNIYRNKKKISPLKGAKSPYIKTSYKLNHDTLLSPVKKYIKGTDPCLIQNVQARTNKILCTPLKYSINKCSIRNSTSSKHKSANDKQQLPSLKFRLSPKHMKVSESPNNHNENKENTNVATRITRTANSGKYFSLPRVNYNLPLQVKQEGNVVKRKTKYLKSPSPRKTLIRHEGRIKSIEMKKTADGSKTSPVIVYHPENESLHVEKEVIKTNFIHYQKNTI